MKTENNKITKISSWDKIYNKPLDVKIGDILICTSNEGYWSRWDERKVTGLGNGLIQFDKMPHWYVINEFRWRCYKLKK